ncbi:hypothetical protein [Halomonas piscis]|uniref:hypothetical protein n=1 Tax=Halomonas piscis TaxID=3031727 RepID=UPI0028A1CC65|nr:hypothetical protein [Halomonas piscis]
MKAIIEISQTSAGQIVTLLGIGNTEVEARRAAYAYVVGRGHNDFDDEYEGGTLLTVSPRLAELVRRGDDAWDDTYDESGRLVESSASDDYLNMTRALASLRVDQGMLDTKEGKKA